MSKKSGTFRVVVGWDIYTHKIITLQSVNTKIQQSFLIHKLYGNYFIRIFTWCSVLNYLFTLKHQHKDTTYILHTQII